MISDNLRQTTRRAIARARASRHEYAGLEHLLRELTGDPDASAVLNALHIDIDSLNQELDAALDEQPAADISSLADLEAAFIQAYETVLGESPQDPNNYADDDYDNADNDADDVIDDGFAEPAEDDLLFHDEDDFQQDSSQNNDSEPSNTYALDMLEVIPTAAFERVIQRAALSMQSAGRAEATGANVLVAMFDEPNTRAYLLLEAAGLSKLDVTSYLAGKTPLQPLAKRQKQVSDEEGTDQRDDGGAANDPLEEFCINLSALANAGKLDPLIGREHELTRLMQVLARRNKNNPGKPP